MHFNTVVQLLVIASVASSAPVAEKKFELQSLPKYAAIEPVVIEKREPVVVSARRTTTAKTTTAKTTTATTTTSKTTTASTTASVKPVTTTSATSASTGGWTSVNQALCPSVTPTYTQPDFNQIPTSCGQSWLDIVNMWRKAYNKPTFIWSAQMASVAYGAAYNASGGDKTFVHSDLGYWHSSAEVESPGYVTPYSGANLEGVTPFSAVIANWLCEVPSDAQLQKSGFSGIDLCTDIVKNTDYIGETAGETGHHDILLGSYATIGCAFVYSTKNPTGPFAGIYVCDFTY